MIIDELDTSNMGERQLVKQYKLATQEVEVAMILAEEFLKNNNKDQQIALATLILQQFNTYKNVL